MKKPLYVVMLVFLAMFMMVPVQAAPVVIDFVSGDGSATSSTGNVFSLIAHPLWGTTPGASWVSAYSGTGYGGGVVLPNWTSGAPTMSFTQTFVLPYGINSGSLTVGADDTAEVWLNSQLLKAGNFVPDNVCASGQVSCEQSEIMTLLLNPYLAQGTNTLTMGVYQLWGDVSGATWSGTASSVPEPSTYYTMGGALLGLGLVLAKLRRKQPS